MEKAKSDQKCLPVIIDLCDSASDNEEKYTKAGSTGQECGAEAEEREHQIKEVERDIGQLIPYEELFLNYKQEGHQGHIEAEKQLVRNLSCSLI
jgi:hypothetical protein